MKIKLAISYTALSVFFKTTRQTVSNIFAKTISRLAAIMKPAIVWWDKDRILCNMPKCFESYKATRVVLDCTEIPCERTKCIRCRILSYSFYKKQHTVKFLIGVAPSGIITFLSTAYGGRASDKLITEQSGVLDLCER